MEEEDPNPDEKEDLNPDDDYGNIEYTKNEREDFKAHKKIFKDYQMVIFLICAAKLSYLMFIVLIDSN